MTPPQPSPSIPTTITDGDEPSTATPPAEISSYAYTFRYTTDFTDLFERACGNAPGNALEKSSLPARSRPLTTHNCATTFSTQDYHESKNYGDAVAETDPDREDWVQTRLLHSLSSRPRSPRLPSLHPFHQHAALTRLIRLQRHVLYREGWAIEDGAPVWPVNNEGSDDAHGALSPICRVLMRRRVRILNP